MVRKAGSTIDPANLVSDYMTPGYIASGVLNGLRNVGQGLYEVATSVLADIKIIAKSSDGVDAAFRFIGESIVLVDVMQRSEKIARPILEAISSTRAFFYTSRFMHSVHYFASGDYQKDLIENKLASFVAAAASAIGRTLFACTWLEQHNLISLERLGAIGAKIGSIPVLGSGMIVLSSRFLYLVYTVEAVALAKNNLTDIAEDKNVARNRVELVSSCAEIAMSALGVAGIVNPYPLAVLGTIAATTSVIAFFLDPSNTTTSKP